MPYACQRRGQRLSHYWPHLPRVWSKPACEDWLAYVERGIHCCDLCGDRQTAACLVLERGILLERLGRLAQAQATLADAINRFADLADQQQSGAGKAHNRLAYVLRGRRMADEAAQHVAQAMHLLAQPNPETHYCHMVWGLLAYDRREWKQAEHHLRNSVDGSRGSQEQRLYAMSLINLAAVHMVRPTSRGPKTVFPMLSLCWQRLAIRPTKRWFISIWEQPICSCSSRTPP